MALSFDTSSDTPPGWSYNPSTWSERLWIVGVAGIGLAVSGYLALYQVGMVEQVWEPWFGSGNQTVLNSFLSHLLPIPDAALGAAAYALDAATGVIGGQARWRTMPWMVILFGLAVGPLGLVSVFLVISQPVLLHAWCTLCLFSALISLIMIGPAMDEVLASLQFLRRSHEQNQSVWSTFWHGEVAEDRDAFSMKSDSLQKPHTDRTRAEDCVKPTITNGKDGHTLRGTWNHLFVMALGVWLMAAPDVMQYEGPERIVAHITGPLVVSMAIIAMAEVTGFARWVNVALGLWLMLAPVLMGYEPLHIGARSALIGGAILLLSLLVKRTGQEQTGGGWRRVWTTPLHTSDSLKQEQQWKKAG
ncbi:MAG TPA: vitamin K epoxide reductase family protein [Nitrospira sp.]|jgi:uncharacterized membrane protein|nr:vitamin K epoxide reductase family protein [Nitrospira sp.]